MRKRPTLLVSGVAARRSDNQRETGLTRRLIDNVIRSASGNWNVQVSWGEDDGSELAVKKLEGADALVIMGGPDVTPALYNGSDTYPHAEAHYRRSDDAQIALVHTAVERGIPTLGICRGMQILNVAQGGTLIQDISEYDGHAVPSLLTDYRFARHAVSVAADSDLADALGGTSGKESGLRILVHSAHHQAVRQAGDHLRIIAWADDGTIEAIEHIDSPVLGVQWHPEDPDADPEGLGLLLERMQQQVSRHATVV